jgi:hypothetical protein
METEKDKTKEVSPCETIQDPIRKGLCKVCNTPIIGEAPFCKDHEPEIP